jgi:hypothetical protein
MIGMCMAASDRLLPRRTHDRFRPEADSCRELQAMVWHHHADGADADELIEVGRAGVLD